MVARTPALWLPPASPLQRLAVSVPTEGPRGWAAPSRGAPSGRQLRREGRGASELCYCRPPREGTSQRTGVERRYCVLLVVATWRAGWLGPVPGFRPAFRSTHL